MGKESFFTRDRANKGIEVPLYDPATGKKTEEWLRVLGKDSDAYRAEKVASQERLIELVRDIPASFAKDSRDKEIDRKIDEARPDEERRLVASLVSGWSFAEKCTRKAVIEFFENAPQVQDLVDEVASKRVLFFANESSISADSPKLNSDLTSPSKTTEDSPQDKPSENP